MDAERGLTSEQRLRDQWPDSGSRHDADLLACRRGHDRLAELQAGLTRSRHAGT